MYMNDEMIRLNTTYWSNWRLLFESITTLNYSGCIFDISLAPLAIDLQKPRQTEVETAVKASTETLKTAEQLLSQR